MPGLEDMPIPSQGQIKKNGEPGGNLEKRKISDSLGKTTSESIFANPPIEEQPINNQLGNPDTTKYAG
tara:strand:+ start:613 stop:816 length:204 start_codon:yes stop_codon:yes gene_type:complete